MTVYSCAPFFNEKAALEIRMREQAGVVDVFVLAEAAWTYAGEEKPVRLEGEWWPWLRDLAYELGVEVRVLTVTDYAAHDVAFQEHLYPHAADRWRRENSQRRALRDGLDDLDPDDVVIVSDLDEVLNARVIQWYRDARMGLLIVPALPMHVAWLDVRWQQHQWGGSSLPVIARMCSGRTFDAFGRDPELLRRAPGTILDPTTWQRGPGEDVASMFGWHLSYLGGRDAIEYKVAQAAHPELAASLDVDAALGGVADLFGRKRVILERVPFYGLPPCVREAPDRWAEHLRYPVEGP